MSDISPITTVTVHKTTPSTIKFTVNVEGAEALPSKASLVIEQAIGCCDIAIPATMVDGGWVVEIPKMEALTESEYSMRIDVVVNGQYFTPTTGKVIVADDVVEEVAPVTVSAEIITEGDKEGVERAVNALDDELATTVGPDTSDEGTELAASVNFPPSGDASTIHDRSTKDDAKHDEINAEKIKAIASSVNGTQGPQLPFDEEDMKEAAKASAKKALSEMMPILKNKPAVDSGKGTLLKPIIPKRDMEKDQAVREALGLPARKKSK